MSEPRKLGTLLEISGLKALANTGGATGLAEIFLGHANAESGEI
ncbi:MAG: hypothetical protein U1C55_13090 [Smithellaceae bacterium]|nr:hypothetical protein [Smithellaceae bacterium]